MKQLRSREELIASRGDSHPDMIEQTKEQIHKVALLYHNIIIIIAQRLY